MASLLYVLHHSTEAPARAATALHAAAEAQRAGHDVALWLSGEGSRLGVAGVAETLREAEDATAAIQALAEGGAVLYVDRMSFEGRMFEPDALRAGAKLAERAELATLVAEGRAAVTM